MTQQVDFNADDEQTLAAAAAGVPDEFGHAEPAGGDAITDGGFLRNMAQGFRETKLAVASLACLIFMVLSC